jgi:hypothetical protein
VRVGARAGSALLASSFRWDATQGTLRWSVTARATTNAVVLRRVNADSTRMGPIGSSRVIARLLGPGMRTATGTLPLNGFERRALESGRLSLAVYGASVDEGALTLPK